MGFAVNPTRGEILLTHSLYLYLYLPMGKKPFIDRKQAKHYHVVHRSQRDPLIHDAEASDRVLKEVIPPNMLKVWIPNLP